jgi:hypothetical protein
MSTVAPPLPEADRVRLLGLEPMTFGSEVYAIFWRPTPLYDAKTKLNPQLNPQGETRSPDARLIYPK